MRMVSSPPDLNVKLFGAEAILAYQEKRKPDFDVDTLKLRFPNIVSETRDNSLKSVPVNSGNSPFNSTSHYIPIRKISDDSWEHSWDLGPWWKCTCAIV